MTLPFALGSSLAIAGGLVALGTKKREMGAAMSVLLFGASTFQVTNNAYYRRDWLEQKSLLW